jgi:hypothetical protein
MKPLDAGGVEQNGMGTRQARINVAGRQWCSRFKKLFAKSEKLAPF